MLHSVKGLGSEAVKIGKAAALHPAPKFVHGKVFDPEGRNLRFGTAAPLSRHEVERPIPTFSRLGNLSQNAFLRICTSGWTFDAECWVRTIICIDR